MAGPARRDTGPPSAEGSARGRRGVDRVTGITEISFRSYLSGLSFPLTPNNHRPLGESRVSRECDTCVEPDVN